MKRYIALLLALTLLLSGCTAAQQTEKTETSTQTEITEETEETRETVETPEDDNSFGLSYLPEYGLNPYTCTATVNRALFSLLYESLFSISTQFRAEPVLCESYRMIDEGRTYVFTLVEGATFSDGTPLTAEDVEASIQAARSSSYYKFRLSRISYYTTQEDGTLLIQVSTPYENLPLILDIPVVKKESVSEAYPVGTGPYKLQGDRLVRNRHWKQTQEPVLDRDTIELSACGSTGELRDNFEFGSTDLVYCDPNNAASVGYRCDYEVWEVPTTVMHYLGFNLYSGYFANNTLRSAVTYLLDREEIVTEFYGGFALGSSLPCSPYSDLYDAQLAESYDYAPTQFRAALQESGILTSPEYEYHQGIFLVCSDDMVRVETARYIAQLLNDAGLNIVVSALDHDTYLKELNDGDFDLYYGETRLTPNFDLSEFFRSDGNLQYGSIKSTSLAELCTAALENTGSFVELCAQVAQEAPICPVVFKSYAVYVTRGKITSLTPTVDNVFHDSASARSLADADKTYENADPTMD